MNKIIKFFNDFLRYGFKQNVWLFFHIYACAIGVRVFEFFKIPNLLIYIIVFAVAVSWEVVEYALEGTKHYPTKYIYFLDTLGDILGVLIIALIMTIKL